MQFLDRAHELGGTSPQFVEQPGILDCDHRLVGKGGDQLYLFFRKRLYARSSERNGANGRAVPQKRNSEPRPVSAELLYFRPGIIGVVCYVLDVHYASLKHRSRG